MKRIISSLVMSSALLCSHLLGVGNHFTKQWAQLDAIVLPTNSSVEVWSVQQKKDFTTELINKHFIKKLRRFANKLSSQNLDIFTEMVHEVIASTYHNQNQVVYKQLQLPGECAHHIKESFDSSIANFLKLEAGPFAYDCLLHAHFVFAVFDLFLKGDLLQTDQWDQLFQYHVNLQLRS